MSLTGKRLRVRLETVEREKPETTSQPRSLADWWWQTAWWVFAAIVAADVLAISIPSAGAAGTVLWYLTYLYVLVFVAVAGRDVLRNTARSGAPFALIVIGAYVLIVVANVNNPRSFSGELSQELNCAALNLTAGGSMGFHTTCLFGYPMRQFLLPVLPTVMFGRSLLNMNLGGDLYFLMGAIIFAGGVTRNFRSGYLGNLIGALLLSVFLQVYFWNHFYLIFEQSIFPLSFALILAGFLLYFRAGERRIVMPLFGILLLWLIGGYTPALAVYALAVAGLIYLAVRDAEMRITSLALVALSVVSLAVSIGYRHDINIDAGSNPNLRGDLWIGLQHLMYQNQGVPWTTPFLVLPLVMVVVLALSGVLGRIAVAVGLWVVGVFVFAVASRGYSLYTVDFRLHRALIVVPVLITLGALLLRQRDVSRLRRPLELLLVVSLLIGFKYHLDYRASQPPAAALPFVSWLQHRVPNEGTAAQPVTMTWMPNGNQELPSVTDALTYFSPHLQSTFLDPSVLGAGCPGLKGLKGIIIAQTIAPCYGALRSESHAGRIHYVGTYLTTDMKLDVFTA